MKNSKTGTWKVELGEETYVLVLKRSSMNTNQWVMWCETNNKEVSGTRHASRRLDSETKKFFSVK